MCKFRMGRPVPRLRQGRGTEQSGLRIVRILHRPHGGKGSSGRYHQQAGRATHGIRLSCVIGSDAADVLVHSEHHS